MFAYVLRRLLSLPLVLFGVSLLIFALLELLSPAQRALAFVRSEKQLNNLEAIIRTYGLDQPLPVQYGHWLAEVLKGNLGWSQSAGMPVAQAIRTYLPATAELALYAFIPILAFGIWLGVVAAVRRNSWADQFARFLAILGWSMPTFIVALWLLQIFYGGLRLFEPGRLSLQGQLALALPTFRSYTGLITLDALLNGRPDLFLDALAHLVLPAATLVLVSSAQLLRVMRSSMLEALAQDYIRTARAKGLPEGQVIYKHALRNALIPAITLSGLILFSLLGGVVITETVFNYPGLGNFAARAAVLLDVPAVLGYALFSAVVITLANLVVDLLYGLVDPRIRFE